MEKEYLYTKYYYNRDRLIGAITLIIFLIASTISLVFTEDFSISVWNFLVFNISLIVIMKYPIIKDKAINEKRTKKGWLNSYIEKESIHRPESIKSTSIFMFLFLCIIFSGITLIHNTIHDLKTTVVILSALGSSIVVIFLLFGSNFIFIIKDLETTNENGVTTFKSIIKGEQNEFIQ